MTQKKPMRDEFVQLVYSTSRPWLDDELIRVDGFKLVYTETVREGLRVRLPGGKWAPVEQLKAAGCAVVMPRVPRVN